MTFQLIILVTISHISAGRAFLVIIPHWLNDSVFGS